jgi:hypothetical protein
MEATTFSGELALKKESICSVTEATPSLSGEASEGSYS